MDCLTKQMLAPIRLDTWVVVGQQIMNLLIEQVLAPFRLDALGVIYWSIINYSIEQVVTPFKLDICGAMDIIHHQPTKHPHLLSLVPEGVLGLWVQYSGF